MKPLAQNTMIQNRYLIVQLIGKGGMGEVYLAVDQRLGSAVALKRTFFAGDEMLGNAFEREARILARMRHPVLPKVSDHFAEGDEQYLVMEHISGDDLAKRLEVAQKPFPLSWVMFWADQLLDALSYLHSHEPPIIHRDIKPQNLKLTDENHVILLDFGLSKSSTGQTNLSDVARSGSSTGSVVGYTPHYAPMEQIRGIGTSPRSDLYSLSATLYQLLTNQVPADALSRADLMLTGKDDPIQPLNELNTEIPPAVSEVILRGMEVSQEKRFGTAREMQKALRKAFASMQNAMTAQTVAFSAQTQMPGAEADRPIAPSMDRTEVMDFGKVHDAEDADSVATRVTGESQPKFDPNATIAYDQGFDSLPRQSDLKTAVFNTGDESFSEPSSFDSSPSELPHEAPAEPDFGMTQDYGSVAESGNGSFGGDREVPVDATMPYVAFEGGEQFASEGFDQGSYDPGERDEPEVEHNAYAAAAAVPAAVAQAPAKKKGSGGKIAAVFGSLVLLFVVAAGAIGGGWWYYSSYYAGGVVDPEPTPSPEMTPEPTPMPEPTYDASLDTVNTNTDATDAGNANREVVTSEPASETAPGSATRPRPSPVAAKPTPVRTKPTPAPVVKPKPAPTRDR
ncbi:MAG TPA: protein kinase, partial [Pyrinomonadaceae bacterium]|nr:protein kinase [Pyrinomonadaceae bacterium]